MTIEWLERLGFRVALVTLERMTFPFFLAPCLTHNAFLAVNVFIVALRGGVLAAQL